MSAPRRRAQQLSPTGGRSQKNAQRPVDISRLTDFERVEVKEFLAKNSVYFTGLPLADKEIAPVDWKPGNPPYQDESGYYKAKIGDHVAYRYELLKQTGVGSFAQVFKATDWLTNTLVALKIIKKEESFAPLLEREIRVLKYLRRGDPEGLCNTVTMLNDFVFRGHVCMVFEMLYTNLYNVLRHNEFKGLPMQHVRKIASHMLKGMEYMHIMGIVHGDLKPENIMLRYSKRSSIKIIDFGWSWMQGQDPVLSDYFQSRFYRAPEVILRGPLTHALDMWSYGCIVAELASGNPIFPGEDKHDQLVLMVEILGIPPLAVRKWGRTPKYFSTEMSPFYCRSLSQGVRVTVPGRSDTEGTIMVGSRSKRGEARGVPGSKHLRAALWDRGDKQYDDLFVDFLMRCLDWDPDKRMTASEATRHKWIAETFQAV